ncbi:MAG: response regulator [Ruminococcus sp.]|nr:response regulator [Ruminococcus sp.]
MKILIADDHRLIVEDLTDELEELVPDAEITGTSQPEKILEIFESAHFDVVIMDIDLNGLNVITIAKQMLEKKPRTNIIYITGHERYALESYETFASAFLVKPVSTEKLMNAMNNLRYPVSSITDTMIAEQNSGSGLIGKRIQKYREERGLSKVEFSKIMGVTLQTVYRWESGERVPDLTTLMTLCRVLGINPDKLL